MSLERKSTILLFSISIAGIILLGYLAFMNRTDYRKIRDVYYKEQVSIIEKNIIIDSLMKENERLQFYIDKNDSAINYLKQKNKKAYNEYIIHLECCGE